MLISCRLAFFIYLSLSLVSVSAGDAESECRASDSLYDGRIAPTYSSEFLDCFTHEEISSTSTYPLVLDLRSAESSFRTPLQSVQKVQEAKLAALVSSSAPVVVFSDQPYSQRHLNFCEKYGIKLIEGGIRSLIKSGFIYQQVDSSPESDPFNLRSTNYANLKPNSIVVLSNDEAVVWSNVERIDEQAIFSKSFQSNIVYVFDGNEYPYMRKDTAFLKSTPNLYYVDDIAEYLESIKKSRTRGISPISKRRCG